MGALCTTLMTWNGTARFDVSIVGVMWCRPAVVIQAMYPCAQICHNYLPYHTSFIEREAPLSSQFDRFQELLSCVSVVDGYSRWLLIVIVVASFSLTMHISLTWHDITSSCIWHLSSHSWQTQRRNFICFGCLYSSYLTWNRRPRRPYSGYCTVLFTGYIPTSLLAVRCIICRVG